MLWFSVRSLNSKLVSCVCYCSEIRKDSTSRNILQIVVISKVWPAMNTKFELGNIYIQDWDYDGKQEVVKDSRFIKETIFHSQWLESTIIQIFWIFSKILWMFIIYSDHTEWCKSKYSINHRIQKIWKTVHFSGNTVQQNGF